MGLQAEQGYLSLPLPFWWTLPPCSSVGGFAFWGGEELSLYCAFHVSVVIRACAESEASQLPLYHPCTKGVAHLLRKTLPSLPVTQGWHVPFCTAAMGREDGLGTGREWAGDSRLSPVLRGAVALEKGPGHLSLEVVPLIVNALQN